MHSTLKRNLAVGTAVVAAATGGGIAWAGTGSSKSDQRKAFLDDVAKRLDVAPEKLTQALKSAYEARLDAAVAAGRLTQAEADALKKRAAAGGLPLGPGFGGRGGPGFGGRGGPGGPGRGRGGPIGPWRAGLDGASAYLGLTAAQLRTELQGGRTLAEVAKAKGKATDGLVDAIVTAQKGKLDEAVKAGRLTDAVRDRIVSGLTARVKRLVEAKPGARHLHRRHEGMRPMPPASADGPGDAALPGLPARPGATV